MSKVQFKLTSLSQIVVAEYVNQRSKDAITLEAPETAIRNLHNLVLSLEWKVLGTKNGKVILDTEEFRKTLCSSRGKCNCVKTQALFLKVQRFFCDHPMAFIVKPELLQQVAA